MVGQSQIKITVIKQFEPKDIIGEDFIRQDGRKIEKCGINEGMEFLVQEGGDMPSDFCHHAWYGLYKNIAILQNGGNFSGWTGKNLIYAACPDGIRPVIFKVERIEM
jgi:uncharacterized repeat protein (TIGR04076 family)